MTTTLESLYYSAGLLAKEVANRDDIREGLKTRAEVVSMYIKELDAPDWIKCYEYQEPVQVDWEAWYWHVKKKLDELERWAKRARQCLDQKWPTWEDEQ